MDNFTAWLKKRKVILVILLVYLVVVVAGLFVLNSSKNSRTTQKRTSRQVDQDNLPGDDSQTPGGKASGRANVPVRSAPVISVENYVATAAPPKVPGSLPIYKFQTNITVDDALAIGTKLGLTRHAQNGDKIIIYNQDRSDNSGWLTYDLKTGYFTFRSYGNHRVGSSASLPPTTAAKSFLSNMGVIDDTVNCPITYKRREMSDLTFVECHRDWDAVGLPILSFLGLVNLPETLPLSDVKPGEVYENTPDDFSIIETSTGQDAKERPDDFNTATVAVDADGSILAIDSNIRQLTRTQTLSPQNGLVAPSEALEKLQQNGASMTFAYPSGGGVANWNQVFPGNRGTTTEAEITDYVLAYLEEPKAQEFLTPMYVVRSRAQLASGFGTTILQTVPATTIGLSQESTNGPEVAAWWDGWFTNPFQSFKTESLKLGTFTFSPTPSPTYYSGECVPAENQLNPIIQLGTLGRIGRFSIGSEGHTRANNYFLIPGTRDPLPDINTVVAEFDKLNISERGSQVRELNKLSSEWAKNTFCPLRLSGGSPTIFTYLGNQTEVTVKSNSKLTYADPFTTTANEWKVERGNNNNDFMINNVIRKFIYYEYKPVSFNKPQNGWIVARSGLEKLGRDTIAKSLGLTVEEEDRLVFELSHAAYDLKSAKLFVGPISQEEVDEKLPILISPTPDKVARYHFYVTAASERQVTSPILTPISRSPFMLLELGAAKGE